MFISFIESYFYAPNWSGDDNSYLGQEWIWNNPLNAVQSTLHDVDGQTDCRG